MVTGTNQTHKEHVWEKKKSNNYTSSKKNMKNFTFLYPVKSALSINVRVCSNNLLRPTIFCFITSDNKAIQTWEINRLFHYRPLNGLIKHTHVISQTYKLKANRDITKNMLIFNQHGIITLQLKNLKLIKWDMKTQTGKARQ